MLKYLVSKKSPTTLPLALVNSKTLKRFSETQSKFTQNWLKSVGFKAQPGSICLVPDRTGKLKEVIAGVATLDAPWAVARLPRQLPQGRYQVVTLLDSRAADNVALGWLLGTYRFTRYKKDTAKFSTLVAPQEADLPAARALAAAIGLGRDLITTPAEDMGPAELAEVVKELAESRGGKFSQIVGKELLTKNYPSIHAVGRASVSEPRLLDLSWGDPKNPKLTLVGKGVCFDTGGLDLKPANSMKLMKKDMGGAATVIAVAQVIMELKLPVRLRVLIPAVENSVAANAFRPLDVLQTRKGLTVEVGNTDAEGRLVLSDALTEADADSPDLLIDIATLTGAARVALGTGMPALFSSDDSCADELVAASTTMADPVWRMPLHKPYRAMLDSRVADINNISQGGYGGAITAALFLQEFVSASTSWMHIDTMGYNLESKPGRPAGGEVLAVRALVEMLRRRYR